MFAWALGEPERRLIEFSSLVSARVAYVTNFVAGTVGFVDVATRELAGTVHVGGLPRRIAVDPNGKAIVA